MSFPTGGPFGMPPGMAPQQFPPFGGMGGGPGMGVQMRMGLLPTNAAAPRMRQPRPTMTTTPLMPGQNKPMGGPPQQAQDPNKPKTTVFVGNISDKAPDALVRGLLTRCGNMMSWKRVQGATGKLQAFGFCEYGDPEASLRAIRLLHEIELGDKKLVVKVDAKTREQLDDYLADKGKSNGKEVNGDEIDEFTRNTDVLIKEQLHQLMSDFQHQLSRQFQANEEKKDKKNQKPQGERRDGSRRDEGVDDMQLEDDQKRIISREIDRFRDTYKANEEREKTKDERIAERKEREKQRELEREKDREVRGKDRDHDRSSRDRESRDRPSRRDRDRDRERERERDREREREKKRREREREEEEEREKRERERESRRERERDRSRDRDRDSRDRLDEEEEYEKRKLERKLREKEEAYQERLRNWESRERKKNREHDKYKEKLSMEKSERDKEAKRLKEFLEDYDDERDDPKYYKGSALERRRKEREKEMDMDNRDRKKELEEFENIKRKILDEGASDAEEEIEKLENEREKHKRPQLRERSPSPHVEEIRPTMKPTFELAQEEPLPVVIAPPVQQPEPRRRERTPDSGSSPEIVEAFDSPDEVSQESFAAREESPQEEAPDPKPRLSFGGLKLVGSNTSLTPEREESASDSHRFSPLPGSPDSVGAASPNRISPEQEEQRPPQQPVKHSNTSSAKSKRRKISVGDVFNQDEENGDASSKKRKLVPIEYSEEEMKAVGHAQLIAAAAEEKRKTIKNLIEKIPTAKEELFNYKVDWDIVDEVLMERRIKPWINKKIIEYIGEEEATLTDFICSKLLAHSSAASILNDITMVLDEEAEVFVVKMWRLLIYEVEAKKHGLVK